MSDDFARNEPRIRAGVAAQGFTSHVGATLEKLADGECVLAVSARPELLQQNGFFHGGVAAYLVDNTTTIAAGTQAKEGRAPLTAGFSINFISPAAGERLICRARVVKPGRILSVVAADVFIVKDGVEKQTATALATVAFVDAASLKR